MNHEPINPNRGTFIEGLKLDPAQKNLPYRKKSSYAAVVMNAGIDRHEEQRLRDCFAQYEAVQAVYLFGSRALGTARKDSDYDLGMVLEPGRSRDNVLRMRLLVDLARTGFDRVDLVVVSECNLVLAHEALRLNYPVYVRPGFDVASFFSKIIRMYSDFLPHLRVQRAALKERILHDAA